MSFCPGYVWHVRRGGRVSLPISLQLLDPLIRAFVNLTKSSWMSNVGIPAKSGIAGGIIGALPGQLGLAAFSPRIDGHGNSVRGVAMCEALSKDMGLHMMEVRMIAQSTMRHSKTTINSGTRGCVEIPIFELRGAVRFSGAELLTRTVTKELGQPEEGSDGLVACPVVLFSLRSAVSLGSVAERILREIVSRLRADGKEVVAVDPAGLLDMDGLGEDERPVIVGTMDQALNHVGGVGYKIVSDHHDE